MEACRVKAELAQCRKCGSFVLLAVEPVRVCVDVSPLDGSGYAATVMGGVERYMAEKRQNGGTRLLTTPPGHPVTFDPATGAQSGTQPLHRVHGCPAEYSKAVKATPKVPEVPVTPGGGSGGNRLPPAPVAAPGARAHPSRATPATARRSDATGQGVRCHICRKLIDQTRPFFGIHHGRWVWGIHEEC